MASNDPKVISVGPGSVPDTGEAPLPLLYGATMYEWVELLNPMVYNFDGTFGMSRPMGSAPINISAIPGRGITTSENDMRNNYGLDLRNPAHEARADIVNRVTIPSGKTVILLGNEAQVIVKQLVNTIMQLEGKQLLLADPFARREVEERVVVNRGSAAERLGQQPQTVQEQLQTVKEDKSEQEFPSIGEPGAVSDPNQETFANPGSFGEHGDGAGEPKAKAKRSQITD